MLCKQQILILICIKDCLSLFICIEIIIMHFIYSAPQQESIFSKLACRLVFIDTALLVAVWKYKAEYDGTVYTTVTGSTYVSSENWNLYSTYGSWWYACRAHGGKNNTKYKTLTFVLTKFLSSQRHHWKEQLSWSSLVPSSRREEPQLQENGGFSSPVLSSKCILCKSVMNTVAY